MKLNGMIHIAIFWCTALNCIHSKEALHEAKVGCLKAEAEHQKSAVERLEAELQFLKAEAELLAAKTIRYDRFCTFECDNVCSQSFSQISRYESEIGYRKAEAEYLKADINWYDWCCASGVLRFLMVFIVMSLKKRLR